MTAVALLGRLRDAGAVLRVEDGRLFLRTPDGFPAALVIEAKASKPALLDALTQDNVAPDPEPDTPAPAPQSIPSAAMVDGLLGASRKRPPSWSDPAALPSQGCYCACCHDSRCWTEAREPKGWRCATCHPPHPTEATRDVVT